MNNVSKNSELKLYKFKITVTLCKINIYLLKIFVNLYSINITIHETL